MKNALVLVLVVVLLPSVLLAQSGSNRVKSPHREAILAVERTPCTQGGTVESCISKKVKLVSVQDMGWETKPEQGGIEVTRTIKLSGLRSPTVYRWNVKQDGSVIPVNGHAIGITKSEK